VNLSIVSSLRERVLSTIGNEEKKKEKRWRGFEVLNIEWINGKG